MTDVLEFTSYISPDGKEYHFDTSTRFLLTEEGLGMPPIEYITQQGPYQHGETVLDYRLGKRTIQMLVRQNSCSRDEFWINRTALLNAIRPNRNLIHKMNTGVLRKKFPDGSMRDIYVFIEQGPIFNARNLDRWDEFGYAETLRFVAHDPVFFDPDIDRLSWSLLYDPALSSFWILPFTFSFTLSEESYSDSKYVIYPGSWLSYPKIIITGPMTGFKITNVTTGEFIELNYAIMSGETIYIDLPYGNKSVVNDLGINLMGSITEESSITTFHIAPDPEAPLPASTGGRNDFTISGSGTTITSTVTLEYYVRYIGI
jgi:hypothetical protein